MNFRISLADFTAFTPWNGDRGMGETVLKENHMFGSSRIKSSMCLESSIVPTRSTLCGTWCILVLFFLKNQVPIQDTLVSHWRSARLAELRLCPQLPGVEGCEMDGPVHVVSQMIWLPCLDVLISSSVNKWWRSQLNKSSIRVQCECSARTNPYLDGFFVTHFAVNLGMATTQFLLPCFAPGIPGISWWFAGGRMREVYSLK